MKKSFYLCVYLILLVSLSACGSSLPPHIAAQFATPSPTPFLPGSDHLSTIADQPINQSDTESMDNINEIEVPKKEDVKDPWASYPGPSLSSDFTIPAPFPLLAKPDDQINILILGSDQRPNDVGFRTDVIMLLSMNSESKKANLISFPRDLYVYQPGYRMDRINSAQSRGGIELSYLTLEYNFGIQVDHYVLVNFNSFGKIIDSLGGIEVNVARPLSDQRDGFGIFTLDSGIVEMDAETALWYVRSRGTSDDFDRNHRQQEILSALFFEAFSFDIFQNASIYFQAYKDTIETDIDFSDLLQLLPLASLIYSGESIGMFFIGPNETIPWITSSNAQVLLSDSENMQALLIEAFLEQ